MPPQHTHTPKAVNIGAEDQEHHPDKTPSKHEVNNKHHYGDTGVLNREQATAKKRCRTPMRYGLQGSALKKGTTQGRHLPIQMIKIFIRSNSKDRKAPRRSLQELCDAHEHRRRRSGRGQTGDIPGKPAPPSIKVRPTTR